MKLYATVNSERGSIGKGGNQFLHVLCLHEDVNGRQHSVISVEMTPTLIRVIDESGASIYERNITPPPPKPRRRRSQT